MSDTTPKKIMLNHIVGCKTTELHMATLPEVHSLTGVTFKAETGTAKDEAPSVYASTGNKFSVVVPEDDELYAKLQHITAMAITEYYSSRLYRAGEPPVEDGILIQDELPPEDLQSFGVMNNTPKENSVNMNLGRIAPGFIIKVERKRNTAPVPAYATKIRYNVNVWVPLIRGFSYNKYSLVHNELDFGPLINRLGSRYFLVAVPKEMVSSVVANTPTGFQFQIVVSVCNGSMQIKLTHRTGQHFFKQYAPCAGATTDPKLLAWEKSMAEAGAKVVVAPTDDELASDFACTDDNMSIIAPSRGTVSRH